jgi:hypothetical protein
MTKCNSKGIQTPIKSSKGEFRHPSSWEFRHPSNLRSKQLEIQTRTKLSVGAICQDIGSRRRAALRDRAHRDDRRVGVIT